MSDDLLLPDPEAPWQPWRMTPLVREPQPKITPDAARAEAMRKQAFQRKLELQALRDKARADAHQQGYDAGFASGEHRGYAEGLEQGRVAGELAMAQQITDAVQPLLELCQGLDQALKQMDGEILERLTELALNAGRQLAGEALNARPEQVVATVQRLLQHEPMLTGKARLWLNPQDLALVQNALGSELQEANWSLFADASITRGGCRVLSPSGELDATIETAWDSVLRCTEAFLGEQQAAAS
jgi:flagellar assembly protein FliH